jgi:hypothetical protein
MGEDSLTNQGNTRPGNPLNIFMLSLRAFILTSNLNVNPNPKPTSNLVTNELLDIILIKSINSFVMMFNSLL